MRDRVDHVFCAHMLLITLSADCSVRVTGLRLMMRRGGDDAAAAADDDGAAAAAAAACSGGCLLCSTGVNEIVPGRGNTRCRGVCSVSSA